MSSPTETDTSDVNESNNKTEEPMSLTSGKETNDEQQTEGQSNSSTVSPRKEASVQSITHSEDLESEDVNTYSRLDEYINALITASVDIYAKVFDKTFIELTNICKQNEEKAKKLTEIREKHLKGYEKYIEKLISNKVSQLFEDRSISDKLGYLSDPRTIALSRLYRATSPHQNQYLTDLKAFEETLDERLKSKTKTLTELTENLSKTQESYESHRKAFNTKFWRHYEDIDSVEIHDLQYTP